MLDETTLRIAALENEVIELKKKVQDLTILNGATNKVMANIYNYTLIKIVQHYHGDRDMIINEVKFLHDSNDPDFIKTIIPAVDERIKIYNEVVAKIKEENK